MALITDRLLHRPNDVPKALYR